MSGDSVETSESLDSNNRLRGVPFGAPLEECRYVEARALVDTGALYMFVPENVLKVDNGSLTFSRRVAENRPPESLIRATMGGTLPYPLVELVVSMRVGEKAVAGTVTAVIAPADLGNWLFIDNFRRAVQLWGRERGMDYGEAVQELCRKYEETINKCVAQDGNRLHNRSEHTGLSRINGFRGRIKLSTGALFYCSAT